MDFNTYFNMPFCTDIHIPISFQKMEEESEISCYSSQYAQESLMKT